MTDNNKFKEEATDLLVRLINYQRKYEYGNKRSATSPAFLFERELRQLLMIVRTDEENKIQREKDTMI